jgi:hypothetical protein
METVYVLLEYDHSRRKDNWQPTGVALTSEEDAKKWVQEGGWDEHGNYRTYWTVTVQ